MGRDAGAGVIYMKGRPQQQCTADTKCVLKVPLGSTVEVITARLHNISIKSNHKHTHTQANVQHYINPKYFTSCINITHVTF